MITFFPEKDDDDDLVPTQKHHHINDITENTFTDDDDIHQLKVYSAHHPYNHQHENYIIHPPPPPSVSLHSHKPSHHHVSTYPALTPPIQEKEASYLSMLLGDIFKANNVNYLTIGMILAKIILFQKFLLVAAVYCIISLHGVMKSKGHHRDTFASEESARFDLFDICGGTSSHD